MQMVHTNLSAANKVLADSMARSTASARFSGKPQPVEHVAPDGGSGTTTPLPADVHPPGAVTESAPPGDAGTKPPGPEETEAQDAQAEPDPFADQDYDEAEADEAVPEEQPLAQAEVQGADPASAVVDEPDPLVREISNLLEQLFAAGAFGVAYHLVRAAEHVFPTEPFRFSADELRLAAMSGRIGHAAMQGSPLLERAVAGAIRSVQATLIHDDVVAARRIVLAAACAELALFHPALPALMGVEAISEAIPELREALRDLGEAIANGARYGLLTPALLRTVRQETSGEHYLESCRKAITANIDSSSKIQFHWVPANKIRASLHQRSGVVGELREKIESGDASSITAAREFARDYRHRSAIVALLDKLDRTSAGKYRGMDGAARERMVSALEDLRSLCAEYAEAADASPSARDQNQKAFVRRVASAVEAGVEMAVLGLESFARNAPPLPAAAASFAIVALGRLREVMQGRSTPVGLHDHLIAVHGPLFWLPGLHYGASWLPTPYDPEAIVNAILSQPVPPVCLAPSDSDYRAAVRARLEDGSFIAARMLVHAGAFYGIGEATREDMAEQCDANEDTTRSELKDRLDGARKLIDKVQRMGALVRLDDANAALAAIDRIAPDTLPADVSFEARGEEEEPEQIKDFCSARDVVSDMCDRVNALLGPPRAKLMQELEALQGAAVDDIKRVAHIIQDDGDLVTAGEYSWFPKGRRHAAREQLHQQTIP